MLKKIQKGLRDPTEAYIYLHHGFARKWYMSRYEHTEGYRRLMEYRINHFGYEQAVGGFDNGIGRLQFNFLRDEGLSPSDTLLDIGCGSLRGGEYYIGYLNTGNYTGMDISAAIVEEGIKRLEELVTERDPTFITNNDLKFNDNELTPPYDYSIAQSVFTHLPEAKIDECLANIAKVVDGRFYATFFDEPKSSPKDFAYDADTLISIAEKHGHSAGLVSSTDYPHPRGQRMIEFRINGSMSESECDK